MYIHEFINDALEKGANGCGSNSGPVRIDDMYFLSNRAYEVLHADAVYVPEDDRLEVRITVREDDGTALITEVYRVDGTREEVFME